MKKIIRLTESDLSRIVKTSVLRALNEGWKEEYNDALDKRDFELAYEKYKNEPWFKRFFMNILNKSPKDPNPGMDSRALANKYAETYNNDEAFKSEFSDGSAAQTRMGFADDLQPVFKTTHRGPGYIDPEIYQSRTFYDKNGKPYEGGLKNFEDEAGFYSGMPSKENAGEAFGVRNKINQKRSEVDDVVKNRRKKK